MSWYVLLVFVHVMSAVVFVGYALFWTVMGVPPADARDAGAEVLADVGDARWPPAKIPSVPRISIVGLGWVLLGILIGTGLVILDQRGLLSLLTFSDGALAGSIGRALLAKTVLLGLLLATQVALSIRARRWYAYGALVFALGVVGASTLLFR